MANRHRHVRKGQPEKPDNKEQIALAATVSLLFVIGFLIAILAFFIFRIGIASWPSWMIDNRKLFIAIFSIPTIFLTILSPVIIEAASNPRTLSGPGKNPRLDLTDFFK